jgi:hypothetical protein
LAIGEQLLPVMKNLTDQAITLTEFIKNFDIESMRSVVTIGAMVGAFALAITIVPKVIAAITAIIHALKAMTTAQAIAQAFSGPKGWLILAGSIAAAGVAGLAVSAAFDSLNDDMIATSENAANAAKEVDKVSESAGAFGEKLAASKQAQEFAKQMESMRKEGEALTESLRTPFEVARDQIANFNKLLNVGAISWETYSRAVAKATGDLNDATLAKSNFDAPARRNVAAVTQGSVAGFSAVIEAQNSQRELLEGQRYAAAQDAERNRILNNILAANTGSKIVVKKVPLPL